MDVIRYVRRIAVMLALLGCMAVQAEEASPDLPPADVMTQPEAFSTWFAGLLATRYPQAGVGVASPLLVKARGGKPGDVIDIRLERFFAACQRRPEDPGRCYEAVTAYLPNVMPDPTGSPVTPHSIVALLRTRQYVDRANKAVSPTARDQRVVARHFIGPLWVVYAYDNSQGSGLLTLRQFRELHLSRDQLELQAQKNLERLLGPLGEQGVALAADNPPHVISQGNLYESSRLLLYEQWQALAQLQSAPLLVSVPARDVLIYTAATRSDAASILRDLDTQIAQRSRFLISPVVLRWTSTGWVEERK